MYKSLSLLSTMPISGVRHLMCREVTLVSLLVMLPLLISTNTAASEMSPTHTDLSNINLSKVDLRNSQLSGQSLKFNINSKSGYFNIATDRALPVTISKIHKWKLVITPLKNELNAFKNLNVNDVVISGGMPDHGHGLPSQPEVVNTIWLPTGQVEITIAGIKFQMWGDWFIRIELPSLQDSVDLHFTLAP